MKIIYLGNFGNRFSDTTEKHIQKALKELGHKVVAVNEKDFDLEEVSLLKGDLFLFHKGGENFGVSVFELLELLNRITYTKVCWYFDKIWGNRQGWMEAIIPYTDYVFLTDETWKRQHKYENVYVLRQGIGGEKPENIEMKKELECEIAFTGSVYGERERFVKSMMAVYGSKFKIFNSVFGEKLVDLCRSVRVFVAPMYPSDDFYWSSRIYQTLGSGGFLIHPRLEGLKNEYIEGGHYVAYSSGAELKSAIDFFINPKNEEIRNKIRIQGFEHTWKNFTYKKRVEELLNIVKKK